MSELPQGWASTELGDVATFEMGQAPPGTASNIRGDGVIFVKAGEFGKIHPVVREWTIEPKKFAASGDILICVVGATAGKLNLSIDCAIGRSVAAIKPTVALSQKSVYFQLLPKVLSLRAASTGSAQGVISKDMLASISMSVPPLNEQKRIADKLDALVARADACRERLDRIPAVLKRFRQSVLTAATSGVLTEDWRTENETSDWLETDVQSVAHVGTGSTPLRSTPAFFSSVGTPWITSAATSKLLVTSADEFVTQAAITAHRLKIYPVGTLLVAMYGEGKTRGQVTELGIPATINQACAAVVVDEAKALKAFIKLVLQANYYEMRELAEGGNQPNLNLSKVKEFPLHLPSKNKQTEIVRRVEALLALADRIEARYQAARTQVDQLTPALLAKAFRGELVPQDPGDEPASVLLSRIRAQRAAAGTDTKTRGRKARQGA